MLYFPYRALPTFILRTPANPYNAIRNVDYDTPWFNNALRLASPELYVEKHKSGSTYTGKMKESLSKYWLRSSTRSTPFGMFASCSVGQIGEHTKIELSDKSQIQIKVRLDMNYLCSLVQYLDTLPSLREQMTYIVNDSLYKIGERFRYVEYFYQNSARVHQLQEFEVTDYLLKVIEKTQDGCTIEELSQVIVEAEDVTLDEARGFVNLLIDNQILKSEIEVAITGEDALTRLINQLQNKKGIASIIESLNLLSTYLLDAQILECKSDVYQRFLSVLDSIPVKYDKKYILQADMFRPTEGCATMAADIVDDLQETIDVLVKFHASTPYRNENMENFIQKFQERYEDEAVPLLLALDSDLGIGYGSAVKGNNPLLDGLILPWRRDSSMHQISSGEALILRKYVEQLRKGNSDEIELLEDDINMSIPIKMDDYISTISAMFQIIRDGTPSERLIYLKNLGGSTAASLLGRFCYLNSEIEDTVKMICDYDQSLEKDDSIVAEIVHLPESRIGNISSRPLLRNAEVHYLAASGMALDKQICASDIMIECRNGRLKLFSKLNGKEIIPRLSNAHNFSYNSVPVYHFLCDYQMYNRKSVHSLYMERLYDMLGYTPRIRYKNVILSLRCWKIDIKRCETITHAHEFDDGLVFDMKKSIGLPDMVVIKEMDNDLLIDFNTEEGRRLFWNMLKQRRVLKVEEFIYDDEQSVITSADGKFCGEFVLSFVKDMSYGEA